jgi:hypothetical protein
VKFKPLKLELIYDRYIGYNNKKVRTIKLERHAKLFGVYKVWQAISGRCFVEVPHHVTEKFTGHISMTTRRKEVKSVEEGILFCQKHYENLATEAFDI